MKSAAHATHAPEDTWKPSAHSPHVVSAPVTTSPAALTYPASHATHAPLTTRWFAAHSHSPEAAYAVRSQFLDANAEGGPSIASPPSVLTKRTCHAVAPSNIFRELVTEESSHPVMS